LNPSNSNLNSWLGRFLVLAINSDSIIHAVDDLALHADNQFVLQVDPADSTFGAILTTDRTDLILVADTHCYLYPMPSNPSPAYWNTLEPIWTVAKPYFGECHSIDFTETHIILHSDNQYFRLSRQNGAIEMEGQQVSRQKFMGFEHSSRLSRITAWLLLNDHNSMVRGYGNISYTSYKS
jgi:hypothetical protein